MTSLNETLPLLNTAVPALPEKVEAVAHAGDALDDAARQAIAGFEHRHAEAATLMDQVRQALTALRGQAGEERQHVEDAAQALQEAADHEVHELDEGGQQLQTEADETGTAFESLQTALGHAGEETHAAHEEARSAVHHLDEQAASKQSELDSAVDAVTAAARSAEQAIREGQTLVTESVSALSAVLGKLLEAAKHRLEQTRTHLEELHAEQETAVGQALSELETHRGQIEQDLTGRLAHEVEEPLEHELEELTRAFSEAGQQVLQLQTDCTTHREQLEPPFATIAGEVAPLREGVEQVKRGADELGIAWP
jgi:chromosome segregation ATPase